MVTPKVIEMEVRACARVGTIIIIVETDTITIKTIITRGETSIGRTTITITTTTTIGIGMISSQGAEVVAEEGVGVEAGDVAVVITES